MEPCRVDLHTHSKASDGTDTPAELVRKAATQKVRYLSLTDHDTLAGLAEAEVEANVLGLTFIHGVELSTDWLGKEMHILGYGVQPTLHFQSFLHQMIESRNRRNRKMIEVLQSKGMKISEEEVRAKAGGEEILSRPHFAQVLVEKGYALSRQDAFDRYLAAGASCYVPRESPDYPACIKAIREAGGVAVFAHPYLLQPSPKELRIILQALVKAGLQGLEVWHSDHPEDMQIFYEKMATDYHLLCSGGSDYHGSNKPHIEVGSGHHHNVNITDSRIPTLLIQRIQENRA